MSSNNAAITGTLTIKTAPHQKCSRSRPPRIGPSALPAAKPVAQTATATRRWARSTNRVRNSARVAGISIAPKKPSSARAATSTTASAANAAANETTPKPATPMSRVRRRPMRSPSVPMVTSRPASTSG